MPMFPSQESCIRLERHYWTRLATQTAGGNAPDLIQMDYRYIFEYARRGTLLDFTPYMGKGLAIDDFGAPNIDSGKVDGKLYGVNLGVNSSMAAVNDPWPGRKRASSRCMTA